MHETTFQSAVFLVYFVLVTFASVERPLSLFSVGISKRMNGIYLLLLPIFSTNRWQYPPPPLITLLPVKLFTQSSAITSFPSTLFNLQGRNSSD